MVGAMDGSGVTTRTPGQRAPADLPVVVGVNGSAAGLAAVRVAAHEAVARGQPLRVVHAFAWPSYQALSTGVPYDLLRQAAAEVLARAVTTAIRSTPAARVSGYLIDGTPAVVLQQQSRTASLLVLGDDDPGAPVPLPTDSVLVQVVARSRCPVLVARGSARVHGPVVVGVDGSASAAVALRYAVTEAVRRGVDLHVAHVIDTDDPTADPDDHPGARALLANALAAAGLIGPDLLPAVPAAGPIIVGLAGTRPVTTGTAAPIVVRADLLAGDPAVVLCRLAARGRLLVVGPSGTGSRFGALLGAVAQTVLRRCDCPIMFVHGTIADRCR
jgi:nucleotide-binding universal stress UspA family protein